VTTGDRHWPEWAIEGALLGCFMIAACGFATILEHPASPVHRLLPDPTIRRLLMGLAMGATAVALIRSPWGRRSGAHMNPALTLTYLRLRKIAPADCAGYVVAQFAGGVAGVLVVRAVLGMLAGHPAVQFAVTAPGAGGVAVAFAAELAISFVLMTVVLVATNDPRLAPYTPFLCGALVATYIAVEAPLSGMSMNPARSFASALVAGRWTALWIYFTAPPLGMLVASEVYVRWPGARRVLCAKLDHRGVGRCIFRCDGAA
jgi:aquaporin Z